MADGRVTDRVDLQLVADERAALLRVAQLVTQGVQSAGVCGAVCEEVARLFGTDLVTVGRFETDPPALVIVALGRGINRGLVGSRWELEDALVSTIVFRTGRSTRVDQPDLSVASGPGAEHIRRLGIVSTVASPIVVEGDLWGAIAASTKDAVLPPDAEDRLDKFCRLVATSIANAESREALGRLVEEQAALRRVATLVAQGVRPAKVFAAVSDEVGRLFGANGAVLRFERDGPAMVFVGVGRPMDGLPVGTRWELDDSMASTQVYRTGRSARVDSVEWTSRAGPVAEAAERLGVVSTAASPIIVNGEPWGAVAVSSGEVLPLGIEERLERFTELLATAIASAEAREAVARLADEQTGLRRVATLVARGAPPERLFAVVAEEVARYVHVPVVSIVSYEDDGSATERASTSERGELFAVGTRWSLEGTNVVAGVLDHGRPVRIDDYTGLEGPIAESVRRSGLRSTVGIPILVSGRLWGAMVVSSTEIEPLPADMESRLAHFTELVATAIANAESREGLARLATQQAALRRVATLVARAAPSDELFAAVSREVGQLLQVDAAVMTRYVSDDSMTVVAAWGSGADEYELGVTLPLGGRNLTTAIAKTRRAARIDTYEEASGDVGDHFRGTGLRAAVGAPIIVDGRLWGVIAAGTQQERVLPLDSEERLADFTGLVATAIANAESRRGLARLAEEQAALRRVATLVARASPPDELFAAVTQEVGQLLRVDVASMARYASDDEMIILALWGYEGHDQQLGARLPLGGKNLTTVIAKTRRPTRIDIYDDASGGVGEYFLEAGIRSAVGAPIIVDGRLWGAIAAGSQHEQPLPRDSEARLANFTELIGTAIANAESRGELAASRARIVTAADRTRREIERDLHDGTQQHLVSLLLSLRAAQAAVPSELPELRGTLSGVADGLADVQSELLEMARGIHPATLARGGLGPALRTLARRSPIAVELDARVEQRLPEPVEVAAYYVVSEALTNAAKHANASAVDVRVELTEDALFAWVADDGIGGADPTRGSGLVGLKDRVEALGGVISVESPVGGGTSLEVELPIRD